MSEPIFAWENANHDVALMPISALFVGYSPRQIGVDGDHVRALAEVLDQLPPIVVDERTNRVIDGVHRLYAFRRVGRAQIRVRLFSGSELDAVAVAIHANVSHGKPLTSGERRAAAADLLRRCPDRSDRWIAEVCGLSHSTVACVREECHTGEVLNRLGKDGRRRRMGSFVEESGSVASVSSRHVAPMRPAELDRSHGAGSGQYLGHACVRDALPIDESVVDRSITELLGDTSVSEWFSRTAVTPDDFPRYLSGVPLSRIYEVADQCRQRAKAWSWIADALESRTRRSRS